MKKINKKVLITVTILIVICLLAIAGYKSYNTNKASESINEFSTYFDEYKNETSTYILADNQEKYENLIKECEQAIANKYYKNVENLKSKLSELKEQLLKLNIESINTYINELESIDISNFDDKESLLSKIEDIKTARDENQFIKANETLEIVKSDINTKLETIRVEEEKKQAEQDAIKNIEGEYSYKKFNKNGFYVRSYSLSIITYGENELSVIGGHDSTTTINNGSKTINIEDATKADEGYANHKSGSIGGNLEYMGNMNWKGFIWDDQSGGKNIRGDNGPLIPTIPIEITLDNNNNNNNNNNITVTVGDQSIIRGTETLTKLPQKEKSELELKNLQKRKNDLEEKSGKMTEQEALSLVEKDGESSEKYNEIRITSDINFSPDICWGIQSEEYYRVSYSSELGVSYLVGKESNLVYLIGNQGGSPAYLMKDRNKIETYEYIGPL